MTTKLPPDDNVAWKVWVGSIVAVVLSTVAVTARLVARRLSAAKFWWDDYFILLALVSKRREDMFLKTVRCVGTKSLGRFYNGVWVLCAGFCWLIMTTADISSTWERGTSFISGRYDVCIQSVLHQPSCC